MTCSLYAEQITFAEPYKTHISLTDIDDQLTLCGGSSKPLPYKSTATFTVGEGLAPPERYVKKVILGEAYLCFRNATLWSSTIRRMTGVSGIENVR